MKNILLKRKSLRIWLELNYSGISSIHKRISHSKNKKLSTAIESLKIQSKNINADEDVPIKIVLNVGDHVLVLKYKTRLWPSLRSVVRCQATQIRSLPVSHWLWNIQLTLIAFLSSCDEIIGIDIILLMWQMRWTKMQYLKIEFILH